MSGESLLFSQCAFCFCQYSRFQCIGRGAGVILNSDFKSIQIKRMCDFSSELREISGYHHRPSRPKHSSHHISMATTSTIYLNVLIKLKCVNIHIHFTIFHELLFYTHARQSHNYSCYRYCKIIYLHNTILNDERTVKIRFMPSINIQSL